jgi:hypothetical protein
MHLNEPGSDSEPVEGRARQPVDPRHRHHVVEGKNGQHREGSRRSFLPENPRGARCLQLRELGVKRLASGADASVADGPLLAGSFRT